MADAIAITKADKDNKNAARRAKMEYQNALHLFPTPPSGWNPKVVTCSALEKTGIREIWKVIEDHHTLMFTKGYFERKRQTQNIDWMHETIKLTLERNFYHHPSVQEQLGQVELKVANQKMASINAARHLLKDYQKATQEIDPRELR